MKKTLIGIVCLLSFITIYAQNITKGSIRTLDQLNGFKDIKLGSPLSNWKLNDTFTGGVNLEYHSTDRENQTRTYKYIGYGYNRMFNIEIDEMLLEFDKDNLLVSILLLVDSPSYPLDIQGEAKMKSINRSFSDFVNAFGTPTKFRDLPMKIYYEWESEKVKMMMLLSYDDSTDAMMVVILDNNFQRLNTGF